MDSISFSNRFYKLDKLWSKQRKHFNYERNIFTDDGNPSNFIAKTIHERLREIQEKEIIHYFAQKHASDQAFVFQDSCMYIYDHRPSDFLPKNNTELEKLSYFMHTCLYPLFTKEIQNRIKKHHGIACCFMIWFLCTPHFYSPTFCLLSRKPKIIKKESKQQHNTYKTTSHSEEKRIPQLQNEVQFCLTEIETILNVKLQNLNAHEIHPTISTYLTENYLGKNKYKKALKQYQHYQKEKQRLDSLIRVVQFKQNEQGIHRSNGTFVPFKELKHKNNDSPEEDQTPCPPPPPILLENDIPDCWEDLDDE